MLREELFTSPQTVFLGCLAWIPLGIWIVAFVHWMIGGDLDVLPGVLGLLTAVGLGAIIAKPPAPQMAPIGLFGIVFITAMFPYVRAAINKKQLRSIDVEGIERAYYSLKERPNNPAARMRIARHLHNIGFVPEAILVMESVLKDVPKQFFGDEVRLVQLWRTLKIPASAFGPVTCPICSTKNDPGETIVCTRCGGAYLLDRAIGRSMSSSNARRLVALWIMIVVVCIAMVAIPGLPKPLSHIVAIGSVILVGFCGGMVVKENTAPR